MLPNQKKRIARFVEAHEELAQLIENSVWSDDDFDRNDQLNEEVNELAIDIYYGDEDRRKVGEILGWDKSKYYTDPHTRAVSCSHFIF
tara:strand:+ start:24 stop:287 length:264 start_codon:yes stop_codon:yes gene_type:complete